MGKYYLLILGRIFFFSDKEKLSCSPEWNSSTGLVNFELVQLSKPYRLSKSDLSTCRKDDSKKLFIHEETIIGNGEYLK